MAQYAIFAYSPAPADWADAPPEELEAFGRHLALIEELGGKHLKQLAVLHRASPVEGRRHGPKAAQVSDRG
jgi:hypothetical protein